jgi:SWI/SNF-related matrix-associated actin-dependent regulator of chromatin subfamily A-like protein 1
MKIIVEETQFFKYKFDYKFTLDELEFCRYLKKTLGWHEFSFVDKGWRFNDLKIIQMIKNRYPQLEIDPVLLPELKKIEAKQLEEQLQIENANEIRTKTVSDLKIKGLKKEPYDYQKIGVEFFINNNGRAILADQPGVGKTLQALAYIVHAKLQKSLVVCPSSVKYAWEDEVKKWTRLKSLVINGETTLTVEKFKQYDVFIINYDLLKKFFNFLTSVRFDVIILDEFQFIKSQSAQRTKLAKEISKHISRRLLLSGTPLLNRPIELFNGLYLMDPLTWKSWYDFSVRYCQGHQGPWGWDTRGASNIPELKQRISRYFLRRLKRDVLPELPPKQFTNLAVELDNETKFEYDLAFNSFVEYLRSIKNKEDEDIRKSMQAEKLVKLGELRQITSMGKIKTAQEVIEDTIDGEEKIVVFSCYNEPLEMLHEKFKDNSVLITGKTPELFRKKYIEMFQKDPSIKIFFGGIKSAGVGITLTAASNVLLIDYPWVPADREQAIDRCHRPGQEAESINIYQLYAKDTIDEHMKDILDGKQEIFNQLIEEGAKEKITNINVIDNLIKNIENLST